MSSSEAPPPPRSLRKAAPKGPQGGLTTVAAGGLHCRGAVSHVRLEPRRHAFRYRVWMLFVDLEHQPPSLRWLRPLARVDGDRLLAPEAVRGHLAEAGIETSGIRIFALTQPASLGYSFNPVNFYFCVRQGAFGKRQGTFRACGGALMAVLLHVTNTPWGEEHCYVLDARARPLAGRHRFEFPKAFHVSPFLSMQGNYRLSLDLRDDRVRISLRLTGGSAPFVAYLSLRTRPLTVGAVLACGLLHPAQNALTLARIYWQAGRLWTRRMPFFPHPGRAR